jgi:chaperone modulatory protein CbpM
MRLEAVAALFGDLDTIELTSWVEARWVRPEGTEGGWEFREVDVARVRLIHDLRHEYATPPETVPMVLGLLDQLYALRAEMRAIERAIDSQPEDVRQRLLAAFGGPG